MIQRSSVAGSRVGGRDDGGALRGDGAVGVGTLVDRGKVSDLERLGKRLSVVCAHASDGGRIGALRGNLKKLKRGAVGGTAREVRLVSDAEGWVRRLEMLAGPLARNPSLPLTARAASMPSIGRRDLRTDATRGWRSSGTVGPRAWGESTCSTVAIR